MVSLDRAKSLVPRHGAPIRWASVGADLSLARRRPGTRGDADLAVELARDAFAVPGREADPKAWALCGQSLMTALAARAERGGRHAVAHAREAEELLREVIRVLHDRFTLPEQLELQADVGPGAPGGRGDAGRRCTAPDAELTLMLARPQAEQRDYARLVDLLDTEAERCDRARVTLGITPVS